jgi:formylglycine-generating enzyme required for sulfatase activity
VVCSSIGAPCANPPKPRSELVVLKGIDLPVESITWNQGEEFCLRLAAITGRAYRLPSEAEWEYAYRAGTMGPFHFGPTITP